MIDELDDAISKGLATTAEGEEAQRAVEAAAEEDDELLLQQVIISNEAIANVSEVNVTTRIFDISTFEAEVKSDVCSAAKEISLSRKMVKGSVVKSIISAVKKLIECEDESYIISKAEYDEVISSVLEMVRNNVPYQVALDGLVQRLSETH